MRFREYNSNAPSTSTKPCAEYILNPSASNKDGTRSPTWSIAKKSVNISSGSSSDDNFWMRTGQKVKQVCSDLFLPVGYPDTVAKGYLQYQIYDSIQGLCSYLRGVVSTSAVLMAAGVGDAEATAMSAAMTWAIRDGLGMIGGLLFSYVASPHFDAHVKEYRLLADVLNDIGLTLDMALPFLMTYEFSFVSSPYLLLTSISTLCKVACGISAGATKGNITDHFSIGGNRADINAKESTQETLVSLIGMVLGVWLTKFLQSLEKMNEVQNPTNSSNNYGGTCQSEYGGLTVQSITWAIFLALTIIHVWANYIGVQRLRLRTLNYERARVALQSLIDECGSVVLLSSAAKESDINDGIEKCILKLPTPENVSESLFVSIVGMFYKGNLHLGVRVKDLARLSFLNSNDAVQGFWSFAGEEFRHERYIIFGSSQHPNVSVMMKHGTTDHDELKAFLHAHLLMWCMKQSESKESYHTLSEQQLITRSHRVVNRLFSSSSKPNHEFAPFLIKILSEKGWDTSRLYLGFSNWRYDCDFGHEHED